MSTQYVVSKYYFYLSGLKFGILGNCLYVIHSHIGTNKSTTGSAGTGIR